jgi:bifunctional non-homologous end joining protein LigD
LNFELGTLNLTMSLTQYKKKRSFTKTPEPAGRKKSGKKALVFAIQKHAASHLHYDLRLEAEGVLKSWAVPKGPSMNPNDKRLAMMVEDHPFDYKDFEGIIPKGNYGAGAVIVWDEGEYYFKEGLTKKQNEKLFQEGFQKGHLSFYLEGEKLKGKFSLIKVKSRGENAWLLVKAKDEHSGDFDITEEEESVISGKTIEVLSEENGLKPKRKARLAKPKKNRQPELLNKKAQKVKKEIKKETPPPLGVLPMLATAVDKPFSNKEWIYEIKWDGYRAMAAVNYGQVELYSRNNKSFNLKFPSVYEALKDIKASAVIDGEIVALDKDGKPSFQLLQNHKDEELNLVYYVFDILYLNGKDLKELPLVQRKEYLKALIEASKNNKISYSDHITEAGEEFFKAAEKQYLEGIMAKRSEGKYFSGKRTKEWLKIKTHKRQEAIICGYTEPKGSRKHFGSLILGVYDDQGKLTFIGSSGGGFDQASLKSLKEKMDKLSTDTSPFSKRIKAKSKVTWIKPKLICEVKFTEWTNEGQMRHPVFLGLREDKKPKEIGFEQTAGTPEKNSEEEISSKSKGDKILTVNGNKLKLTNLDKVYFPEEGFTKGDIINYYSKVAKYILPHLKDRPQSMNRHPNGIHGPNFFQKDVKNMPPDWAETIKVDSDSRGSINYLVCSGKATLMYMANLGCIEINPWSSRTHSLEHPDYMIIDLDPLNVDFDVVVEAALAVKEVLDYAKIPGFPKTSGSKGMHILVPLGAKYTYEECKQFAHIIVKIVHKRLPETTSLERSPKKRPNKLYLDYLQNNRGQTIAAPYCVRPRNGATVSTPLEWEEIKPGLHPSMFTIENVLERFREKGDLYKGLLQHKGIDMMAALKKLKEIM